eukprot:g11057.t1 g11057   contig48:52043-53138(+)
MKHHLPLLSLLVTCLTGYSLGFAPSSNLPSLASSSSLARKFHHVAGFASSTAITNSHSAISSSFAFSSASSLLTMGASSNDDGEGADPNETIARRIVVTGDVAGGYYRSCVKNEAKRFRKLIGTMSPPDDSKRAEIYVEGKRKMVEGFVRWCQRGDAAIGLSQKISVDSVEDEFPTGLYDDFYVQTGREE